MSTTHDAVREAFEQLEAAEGQGGAAEPATAGEPAPVAEASGGVDKTARDGAGSPEGAEGDDGGGSAMARARDASGKFTKADKTETPKPGEASKTVAPKAEKTSTTPPVQGQPSETPKPTEPTTTQTKPPESRAPQSWKPTAREHFAKLPAEVQAEVVRREKETTVALQEAAEDRKGWRSFREAVAPFEGMIRAEGSDPIKAVGNLLQTAAALRTAPPAHRAQIVANMVKTFGVPIDALDAALAGEAPPQGQQPAQAQYRDPRVDQLLSQLEQAKQTRAQSLQQEAAKAREAMAAKEFFEDVREDMADLIEARARRGVVLTPEQAYDLVVRQHRVDEQSEIGKVLRQREAAEQAKTAQVSTQQARAASSSIKSQPAAPMTNGAQPKSTRDAVEQAWEQLASRR